MPKLRPIPTLLAAFGLAGLVVAATPLARSLQGGAPDYETLPPEPAEVLEALEGAGVSTVKAIESAEEATGGKATSARFDPASGTFSVETFTRDSAWRVELDGQGEVASKEPAPRFPGEPVNGEPTTTSSGLAYYVIREGTGESPSGPTASVTVHYTGWLVDGTKFDSSRDRGQPATFGLNQVIAGWTEGVGSMRVGEQRKLLIPYQLAYGPSGRPGSIPPRATLIFDVELLAAK